MANEEPAFLTAGVEVSAKYRGAFCEAKVKKVDKNVKCKVTLKDDGKVLIVQDEDIKGLLRVGATVEVKKPESGNYVEGIVNRINDLSIYTVVFDDGDENTLRRTKLCLKGDRHFMKSETLDDLPLTHPEHFGTPVVRKVQKCKATSTATCSESESDAESSDDDSETGRKTYSIHSQQNLVGRVLCVELEERSRRASTIPVLVVLPSADDVHLPSRHHVLVKSFKDGKFFTTTISNTKELRAETETKNKDKALKIAFDRAQNYKENKELPLNWSKMDLLGYTSSESDESDDDEPDEKKDRFVAELFKFMDDRGTPINKAPNLGGIDLNLFKLFRIVQSIGGYNRVTNQMKWHVVHSKLNLPSSAAVVSTNIKQAYKKYLHAFEDFNRKLGCTMVMSSHSRMSSRSLVSFRERERDQLPKNSRIRRVGSVKDDEIDRLKRDLEVEKMDRVNTIIIPTNKTGVGGELDCGTVLVKQKVMKKCSAKKDSGDSDSVSSDIVIVAKTTAPPLLTPAGSKTGPMEGAKTMAASLRIQKDCEKPLQNSSKTVKEDTGRVTRGDSQKTKDVSVKEELPEKSKSSVKGDGRDAGKIKAGDGRDPGKAKAGETDKPTERVAVDKEKHKGSRRMLRRTLNIPNAGEEEEEAEDETKSTNSENVRWDERNESNDSITNDEPKADSEIPKMLTGRKHAVCDEMYAVGTRLQVKYGKGKGQKTYEAKVLETAVQTGIVKYFVHYNGWNSRYDEWIHKDVIVSVLEEPALEMPKLRNATTPATRSLSSSVRKKVSLPTSSLIPLNKEDGRPVKGRAVGSTLAASRQTRSNSLDQAKTTQGRNLITNLKAAEIGLNSSKATSSSTSSLLSLSSSETEEKENTNDEKTVEEIKEEQNPDEDLSNSYNSCSPLETPEMPDIYLSEEDEPRKDGASKIMDQEASTPEDEDSSDELPLMESVVAPAIEGSPSDAAVSVMAINKIIDTSAKTEISTSERLPMNDKETQIREVKCNLAESAKLLVDIATSHLNEASVPHMVLDEETAVAVEHLVPAEDASSISMQMVSSMEMPDEEGSAQSKSSKADIEEEESSNQCASVESSAAVVSNARRKKKLPDSSFESAIDDSSGCETKAEEILSLNSEETKKNDEGAERAKKTSSHKRKLASCLRTAEDTADETDASDDKPCALENGLEENRRDDSSNSKPSSLKPVSRKSLPGLTKDSIVCKDKPLKKVAKIVKTGSVLNESSVDEPDKLSPTGKVAETDCAWQSDGKLETKETETVCKGHLNEFCRSRPLGKIDLQADLEGYLNGNERMEDRDKCFKSSVYLPQSSPQERLAKDEERHLIPEFSDRYSEEMVLKNVLNDSPPASAGSSPSAHDEATSPSHEEQTSTKSEQEANLEVEAYMGGQLETSLCCDSQSGYDFSLASSDSTTSSSSSVRAFNSELLSRKKKFEDESSCMPPRKRRKEKHTEENTERMLAAKHSYHHTDLNDSDHENGLLNQSAHGSSPSKSSSSHCISSAASHRQQHHHHHLQQQQHHFHRASKYNFIDLEEGKYLEGEDRITFLTNKIQDLRAAYMELKAEVASIDRRRRRHRVKEKEMLHLSGLGSSAPTITSSS